MGTMTTYYIYMLDSLEYLGAVDAADHEAAGQLAASVWTVPSKVLTWRLRAADHPVA